jgi:hypothetical protein
LTREDSTAFGAAVTRVREGRNRNRTCPESGICPQGSAISDPTGEKKPGGESRPGGEKQRVFAGGDRQIKHDLHSDQVDKTMHDTDFKLRTAGKTPD